MLLLTKIRLVNWHFFIDETIEAGQATLLAGDNGSGKSTIIDAVQYALVANIRRIKFNAAATEKRAGRTLESYCRCRVGTENREYLREDTITHVMLQFEDGDRVFSAGIMVESLVEKVDSSEYPWIADDRPLELIPVYEGSQFMRPGEFRENIKENGGTVCASKGDYNSRLTHRFGVHRKNMEFNPYLEALVRSVSFSPFTSVHDFVCNYILEERQVDVSAMRENLQNYREAEAEANLIQEKIDYLEEVDRVHHELKKLQAQIVSQQYLKKRADLELCGQRIREYTRLVDEKNRRLELLEGSKSALRDRKKRLEDSRQELLASLYNNDTYMALQSLERSIEEVRSRREEARRGHEKYLGLKDEAEKLLNKTVSEDIDGEIQEVADSANGLRRDAFETEQQIRQNQDQLAVLEGELEDLRKGILRYPDTTTRLQAALEKEGIQAWVLADCLEVNDQSWQNALEGWLAGRRFNLLVSEKNFQRALVVYDSLPGEVHTVGIPDMEKIKNSEITPGSLAEVVITENPLARRYISFVLGEVMMATLDTLRQYRKSVSRECMRYSSFTASRIPERLYGQWYIGKQARERRRQQVEQEIAGLRQLLQEQKSSLETLRKEISQKEKAINSLGEMKHYTGKATRAEELDSELNRLETEKGLVDQSEVKDLRERVASMEMEISRVSDEIESIVKETGSLESDIRKHSEDRERREIQQQDLQGGFDAFMEEHGSMREELEKYYHERVKNDSLEGVLLRFESSMKGFVTRADNTRKELHRHKNEYNRRFATYMSPDDDQS
ncbi:MAG: ATP-binding protein, partial [Spirochaetota bacterium]